MLLLLSCLLLATAAAAPATSPHTTYDQRQDGKLNVQADVQNVMLLVLLPSKKINLPLGAADLIGDLFSKKSKNSVLQNRADLHVLGAFVEPSSPYHVEIGDERSAWSDKGENAEVVISGRGRPNTVEAQPERVPEQPAEATEAESNWDPTPDDEFKLLGALEQCGPGRRRDPDTLMCREDALAAGSEASAQPITSLTSEFTPEPEKSSLNIVSDSSVKSEASEKVVLSAEPTTSNLIQLRVPPPVKSLPPVLFPKPPSYQHQTPGDAKSVQTTSNDESMWYKKPVSPAALVKSKLESFSESSSAATTLSQTKTSTQPVSSVNPSTAQDPEPQSAESLKASMEPDTLKVSDVPAPKYPTLHPSIRIVDLS